MEPKKTYGMGILLLLLGLFLISVPQFSHSHHSHEQVHSHEDMTPILIGILITFVGLLVFLKGDKKISELKLSSKTNK